MSCVLQCLLHSLRSTSAKMKHIRIASDRHAWNSCLELNWSTVVMQKLVLSPQNKKVWISTREILCCVYVFFACTSTSCNRSKTCIVAGLEILNCIHASVWAWMFRMYPTKIRSSPSWPWLWLKRYWKRADKLNQMILYDPPWHLLQKYFIDKKLNIQTFLGREIPGWLLSFCHRLWRSPQ